MKISLIFIALSILSINTDQRMQEEQFAYLALGDSYTIGEAVEQKDRWPVQLVTRLNQEGIGVADPKIVAKTGWTTDELMDGIEAANIDEEYAIVSLLIGVNNQYRGYPMAQYEKEFEVLLDKAIQFAGGKATNVFVISIPDYGVTSFSKEKALDAAKIANELDRYNSIAERIAKSKNANFTNITVESKQAQEDSALVATDGLHPSAKMYTQWVDKLYPSIYNNLFYR